MNNTINRALIEAMKKLNFKSIILTLTLLLTLSVGQMWAGKGFWGSGQWNVKYYDGSGSDKWIGEGNDGATKDLGIKTTLYLKGSWVKTWSDGGWTQSSVVWNYGLSSSYGNTKTATKSSVQGNQTWDFSVDYNVIANAPNNPGQNTIYMYWRLDDYVSSTASYINFTIPGFKKTSVSQTFNNTTVGSNSSKTISFTQHYGTALTTSNCALSGTNSSEFEVTGITETDVTVKFKPTSNGSKSATLTITDAHSKTCTITLSGKTRRKVTYKHGDYTTGDDITAYKVYGTNLTLRSDGFTRTGYDLTAWNTNSNGTSGTSYALGATYSSNSTLTLYPTWTAKTTTITLNNQGATTTGTTEVTATYDQAMPAITIPTKTGYTFGGYWGAPGGSGPKLYNADGSSNATWQNTESTYTLYAAWAENKSTVTLVASPSGKGTFQVGGETVTSTQAGVTTTPSVTAYPISGYRFTGWSISGGASISSTSDNPTTVTGGGAGTAATLTATFEENLVYYDVTFGVGTSYTSLGSLSATNNTTSSAISSGDDILSASNITFTATPNTGYVVEGWYTDAACTTGKHDAGSTTYTIASLSSAVTVYVKFVEKTWSVAFAAGTGGTVTTPNSTPRTVGQVTGISIAATPATGYTFNTWTITSGSGSFTSAATTNSNKFKPTAASTITASFNETKSTITVTTATSSQGTLKFGSTSKSWGATASLGVATTQSITATAAAGFRFVRWDLSGAAASSSTLTNTTITLKADGSGSTGTATAVFEEDLSSPWIVAGGNKIVTTGTTWRTTADANNTMLKKTGHSTESVVYFTVPVTTVCSGDNNENFQFKIYNTSTSKWYGLFASGSYYLLKAEDGTEKSLVLDNQNIELRAYVTGDYEFKLDYSTSTPKLTVTWPVYNQVRISAASPTDATNTGNYDLSDPVSNVRSATRSLNANTTYTFKIMYNSDWYGFNSGTFTRSTSTSSNSRTISTSGGDMTLTTDYAGDYTFKFNESTKALSVDFPTAYKITFGKGSVDGTTGSFSAVDLDNGSSAVTSNSTWVKSGNRVKITAPSAKSGYRFLGWYDNNSATGDAITTLANCTITVNTTKTVYACYAENLTAITITTDGHGTITTPSPNSSPYSLGVTTGQAINASASTGYHWNTWTVSGTAALGTTATTASNTAKGNGTNGSTGTVTATFSPNTYSVKFNGNGSTSGSMSNQAFTYDVAQNLTSNAFVKTGYNFAGWATAADGSVVYSNGQSVSNLTSTNGATYDLYAKWTPKQSALTLDYQTSATGYGSSGSISNTSGLKGTYDAAMTALTGTMPSGANGYAFMGFYDATGGSGTKYYNADGSSAHNWDKDTESGTTLYAYYKKAEIAAITFDNAVVESNGPVSFAVTVSPTPVGDTKLCFTVLHSNDNPLAEQPTITYNGGTGKYSFTAPEASGTYKIEAVLLTGTSCDGGTELDTEVANFQVAGIHTVTVRYKCGDDVIKAATTVTGRPLDWSDAITAPEIFGYTFSGWTTGDGVTLTDDNGTTTKVSTTEATIRIKAIYDGSLIASYAQKKLIYFKNTLGWSDVYVNFHTANAWNNTDNGSGSPKGVGNSGLTNRNKHMIQIGESDIYYYDYGEESIEPSLYISFTNKSRDGVSEFWAENPGIDVVYPANYPDAISTDKSSENGFKAATPMFVPLESQEAKPINVGGGGKANYYNAGYWTKYTPGTGYTLEIYNSAGKVLLKSVEFTSEDELMPMKAVVDLEAGQTYKYQLRRGGTDSYGIYYGNSGTMTYANHGSPTPWDMSNGSFSMCGITTNAAGDYTFNLSYSGHAAVNPHYRLRMAVDYPIASGDYRVIYKDNVKSYWKPSAIVPKVDNGKDIVSFFIRPGSTPYMKIQQSSVNASTGAITWSDYYSVPTETLTALTKDSVYNVCIAMNGSGGATVDKIEPYTGNYYIRVDAANSKWDNYRSDPDHLMTYSEYSITHGGYSHYYCHWVDKNDAGRKNVKFCIANDYSPCISDTLTRETASGDWTNITYYIESNGDLKRNANVRFMWNRHDNTISRAYVDGAQEDGSRFLVISSTDGKIKKADGSSLSNNEVTFSDNENWIYEANVKAQPEAAYKLISTWGETNKITQYFKGSSSSTEKLIGGSGEDWYDIRLLYDFKTNRLIASFVPTDQNITSENAIEADIMFIREHQGDIAQLTFGESGKISKINTAYGVIRFNKWTLANKSKEAGHAPLGSPASIYERSLFWISFPFRVKLSEVFGFGTYGEHWAIQRYDGAARAAKGHFQENGSFWRWMNRNTEYLEPNQGYLLAIDLDLLDENSDVWGPNSRSEQIELFFPSYGTMPDITDADVAQTIPSHECTINWYEEGKVPGPDTGDPRTSYNRTIFDSHWNVMSVPTYVNTDDVSFANTTWTAKKPSFLYTWNADDNTITATSASGYTYHAMHAYMAQYAGGITWTASSGSPASIVARKTYAEQPKEVEFRLELQQNEKMIDQTFVILSNDEEVSADFHFGEDMTKEFNASKASIYTFIPNVATVAGNTLPMTNQTTTVPVGVDVKANGDYTFSMPAGTSGIGVTLIDNETGARTSLGLMDYTVTLTAGTYDQRFVLEIPAVTNTPTGLEELTDDGSPDKGVRKVLIDNKLFIIKDGKIYDATGRRINK